MGEEILSRVAPPPDKRLQYESGEYQFGDLRVPVLSAGVRAPLVVFLHGGWWKAEYGLEYGGHLCGALKAAGIATWSLEYRRVGDAGGGFPGTFEDVAAGYDYLGELAKAYPIDLARVIVVGHSAGGHLAFWLAGRPHSPESGALARFRSVAIPMRGVIALAGAVDLRLTIDLAGYLTFAHDKVNVVNLMGGLPVEVPDQYRAGNPGDLLPLNVPQFLLQGTEDDQIPAELPRRWTERGKQRGEHVSLEMIAGADHYDLVDPKSKAWPAVLRTIRAALG